jgi:nucleoid DNA-binding protein
MKQNVVTQKEIIAGIVEKSLVTQKTAKETLRAMIETILEHLEKGDDVRINNLGTFKVRLRAGGERRNPRTGEMLTIPDKNRIVFKAASSAQERVQPKSTTPG